jgi:hypothetical protein
MPSEGIVKTEGDHWLSTWISSVAFKPEFFKQNITFTGKLSLMYVNLKITPDLGRIRVLAEP